MAISWEELTLTLAPSELEELCEDWRWLTGSGPRPFLVGRAGIMLLEDAHGVVHRLDPATAGFEVIAFTRDEFEAKVVEPKFAIGWLAADLVTDQLALGMHLGPRECLGFKVPPKMGGSFEPDNLEPEDVSVHFRVLAQVARHAEGLPAPTPPSEPPLPTEYN